MGHSSPGESQLAGKTLFSQARPRSGAATIAWSPRVPENAARYLSLAGQGGLTDSVTSAPDLSDVRGRSPLGGVDRSRGRGKGMTDPKRGRVESVDAPLLAPQHAAFQGTLQLVCCGALK